MLGYGVTCVKVKSRPFSQLMMYDYENKHGCRHLRKAKKLTAAVQIFGCDDIIKSHQCVWVFFLRKTKWPPPPPNPEPVQKGEKNANMLLALRCSMQVFSLQHSHK